MSGQLFQLRLFLFNQSFGYLVLLFFLFFVINLFFFDFFRFISDSFFFVDVDLNLGLRVFYI